MFAGHYGVGYGAKEANPRVPLWVLFLGVQLLDVVWSILILANVEKARIVPGLTDANDFQFTHYPYSHSLVGALGWSILAYAAVRLFAPRSWRTNAAGFLVGAAVFSHWPLDLIVHPADLPLWDDAHKLGLDLWKSAPATFAVETALVLLGVLLYLRATRGGVRAGLYAAWVLAALIVVIDSVAVFGTADDVKAAAATGLFGYLFLAALGWLVDRLRRPGGAPGVEVDRGQAAA
jgi:hypothetical protein